MEATRDIGLCLSGALVTVPLFSSRVAGRAFAGQPYVTQTSARFGDLGEGATGPPTLRTR
jgi:hypothetical protein